MPGDEDRIKNTLLLSAAFVFLMTSGIGTTNVMGAQFGEEGAHAVSMMYVSFAIVAVCFAPYLVQRFSARRMIALGTFLCIFFLFACVSGSPNLLLMGGLCGGVGGSLLWSGQGTYLTLSCTAQTTGKHAGVFAVGMALAAFFGYSSVFFFLSFLGPTEMYLFFVGCNIVAIIISLTLPFVPGDADWSERPVFSPYLVLQQYRDVLVCRSYRHAIPWFAYTGFWMTYIFWFATVVGNTYGPSVIGAVFIAFSLASSAMAFVFGTFVDKFGISLAMIIGLIPPYVSLLLLWVWTGQGSVYVIGVIMGIGDAAQLTITNAYVASLEAPHKPLQFSLYQAVQSVAASLLTLGVVYMTLLQFTVVIVSFSTVSATLVILSHHRAARQVPPVGDEEMGVRHPISAATPEIQITPHERDAHPPLGEAQGEAPAATEPVKEAEL